MFPLFTEKGSLASDVGIHAAPHKLLCISVVTSKGTQAACDSMVAYNVCQVLCSKLRKRTYGCFLLIPKGLHLSGIGETRVSPCERKVVGTK